ncbi:MAG: PAS domain-containing hybrid sensor histidine kinase/response regulator [Betaproteobacteria bacterium]|nr:MAG: PAS domain-containing hybrid sensor histidine kinase/response regulator [Betaproteobacteria bacterium]
MAQDGRPEKDLVETTDGRMRSVVDHVIDGIITIDERGDIESFNPAAEKIFGYRRAEVLGRNVKILMPEPYHSEHDAYLRNYLGTGRPKIIGIGREVVGRRKDGSTFPMDLAVSEFHIGPRRYFTGIVRDITERKRLESQLHERVKELASADRQKDEFLAMLSHELRNPLAPMRNALYLLERAQQDPETMQMARDVMERQMHQLVRLVDDLLDVSRIIRGKIELRRDRIDIGAVVARAVETAQPVIDAHGHAINVSLPERPLQVEGDMVRLAQVLANLLTNAAKYSGSASRIEVIVRGEGGDALIVVRDQGVGIPHELLPRIFDLFVQGEHTLARSQGGLGIGLTLAKRLVEMHGGSVAASSAGPGRGSEFSVRLPLAPEGARADPMHAARPETAAPGARKRLLVVDDNVDAAETIARLLRLAGYEAECVYDGPSALEAAERREPDIVVLDIGLPGMDGYEVARRLRARFHRLPLIAVTGYGQDSDRKRSAQAGFNHHFTKPVDPLELERFIARLAGDTRR